MENARVSPRAFASSRKRKRASRGVPLLVAGVCSVPLAFGNCSRDRREPPATAQSVSSDTEAAAGEVSLTDTAATSDNAVWITDANALAILRAMNTRQIAAADVELESWHNDTIRAFAASVARDHAQLQHSMDSVVERLRLWPVMSALGQRIDSQFQTRTDSLRGWSGPGFEHGYVRQQVTAEQAIVSYTTQLTGAAHAPEVLALLQAASARAAAQVSRARARDAQLAIADSGKAAAKADSLARAAQRAADRAAARAAREKRAKTPN
jgi:predicted outer membrane protein